MRLFIELSASQGFSRAVLKTGVTQSALSRTVKHMETTLGTPLFTRSGRGITLTEDGRVLHGAIVDILRRYDTAIEEIRSTSGILHGTCSIVMPESVGRILFLPLIEDMRHRHPKCSVHVSSAVSATIATVLENRQADVGIVTDTHPHTRLDVWPLARESLYLVGLKGDPLLGQSSVSLRKLANHPLMLPASPNGIRSIVDRAFRSADVDMYIRLEIDVTEVLIDMVSRGSGYTIMPFSSIHREIKSGRLAARKITSPELVRTIFCALPQGRPVSPVAREVARSLLPLAHRLRRTSRWSPI